MYDTVCQLNANPNLGSGDQENGQEWKPRGVQDPGQAAGPAKEAEEPDVRRQLQGDLHVNAGQGHELPNEDGRRYGHHRKGKWTLHWFCGEG